MVSRPVAANAVQRDSSCRCYFLVSRTLFVTFQSLIFILVLTTGLCGLALPQATQDSGNFENLAAQALSAREAGRLDEAVRDYQAAVKLRPDWEEGWWYIGTLLYDSDHFAEAIPALNHVVGLDPNLSAGWAFLGLCEFETRDYLDSLAHLKKASELGLTDDPEIKKISLYHLALLLNVQGEFEKAIETLASAAGSGALSDQVKMPLGMSLLRIPLLPTQLDTSNDALVLAAGETEALVLRQQIQDALRSFERLLREYPDTPYLHYQYGMALHKNGQDQLAEAQFQEEKRLRPNDPLPWIALSRLRIAEKKFPEAILDAKRATELAPASSAAFAALADALRAQGDVTGSASALNRSEQLAKVTVERDAEQIRRYAVGNIEEASVNGRTSGAASPGNVESNSSDFEEMKRRAESARQQGRLDEAATLYLQAVKIRSNWQEGWRQLGTLEYMRGHYSEAISALRRSVTLEASQPDTWTLLGLSEFETKDYKNSRIHLERGRSLGFSGNAAAVQVSRYRLALLANLQGDFDEAIDLLTPEVRQGTLAPQIEVALGVALLRIPALPEQIDPAMNGLVRLAGEAAALLSGSYYDKAFKIFEQMLSENSKTPFLHYAYGDALASLSKYDAAQAQLTAEIEINPKSELAYIRLASILLTLRKPSDAIQYAQKAVGLAPQSADAHYELGRAFLEQSHISEAVKELEAARHLAPKSPKVHFNLAKAYARANRVAEAAQERQVFERLKQEASQKRPSNRTSILTANPAALGSSVE